MFFRVDDAVNIIHMTVAVTAESSIMYCACDVSPNGREYGSQWFCESLRFRPHCF